jgi:hypothetical protein
MGQMSIIEEKNYITEDGYFVINTALFSEQKNEDGFNNLNLNDIVQEQYIPELNEDIINSNRHRYCHILPSSL